ncbi:tellurite resistance protein TehA-like permease [Kitasatospora gansuensis]|uniref:Tellurite resistance protein TehA-like permease n=2 Tax=Kitasatospora gansuensis TaxID=258050 RepID=A0A7W7SLA8_9ACTN|nr:tellurite resistance protein TehA-like permease [Kitasatospora gansuensis]
MATGIVSVGLHLTGRQVLSAVLLVLAAGLWVVLAADFTWRLLRDRDRWITEADTPPALTGVAATCVLGTRLALSGRHPAAAVLLAVATLAWPGLLITVIRHWRRRMPGAAFLVCVATQALAVLAAVLAPVYGSWLARGALVLFCLGVLLYGLALFHFDPRQVVSGAGDQWVAGGAMAISALAGSKLLPSPLWTGTAHTVLRTATLTLLGLALAWYLVLAAAELARPRLSYDIRRWATVFPLGMTAVACLNAGPATGVHQLSTLGRPLLWIATAVWLLTLVGFLRRAWSEAADPTP